MTPFPLAKTELGQYHLPPPPLRFARAAHCHVFARPCLPTFLNFRVFCEQLDSGTIRGVAVDGVVNFLGVPFAEPPLGSLRWAAPQRKQPWTGILNTTWIQNSCTQGHDAFTLLTSVRRLPALSLFTFTFVRCH